MHFDKQNKNKAMQNVPKHQINKSQAVQTNDFCPNSAGSSKKDERVKVRLNKETICNLEKPSKENLKEVIHKDSVVQIYTSPREFHNLRKTFECVNKTARLHNEKPDIPCTCENCALMGIVRDSQKIPFADEVIRRARNKEKRRQEKQRREEKDRDNTEKEKRNKTNSREEDEHSHCHQYKQVLHKIKDLEERLKIQEETTVPKVEFKKIITKLVTGFEAYKNQRKTSISTQCEHVKEVKHSLNKPSNSQPPLVTEECPESSTNQGRGLCDKKTSPIQVYNHFWKWGEEILQPGIDIKNKILLLLEDTLNKFPKNNNKPDSKTLIAVDTSNKESLNVKAVPETKTSISLEKNVHCSDTSLRISYINPGPLKESNSSIKSTVSDMNLNRASNSLKDTYKEKFNKIVHYSSPENRQRLWDAVWRQCLIKGFSKNNTASVHFPQMKGTDRIIVQFTVEELENLLIGKKVVTT